MKEFTTNLYSMDEEDEEGEEDEDIAHDIARLKLCRTMDERCELLKGKFGARWYRNVEDYEGVGYLNAWSWKETGEVGRLETTRFEPQPMRDKKKQDV